MPGIQVDAASRRVTFWDYLGYTYGSYHIDARLAAIGKKKAPLAEYGMRRISV
jgi:hypothetical protein